MDPELKSKFSLFLFLIILFTLLLPAVLYFWKMKPLEKKMEEKKDFKGFSKHTPEWDWYRIMVIVSICLGVLIRFIVRFKFLDTMLKEWEENYALKCKRCKKVIPVPNMNEFHYEFFLPISLFLIMLLKYPIFWRCKNCGRISILFPVESERHSL